MTRVIKYIFYDLLRTRFMLLYTAFLLISTFALFQLDSDTGKIVLSLLNIVLIVIPLISIVFTTIHFFNSYEFIELMLAQPVNRRTVFLAEYMSVAASLCSAYVIGIGVPSLIFKVDSSIITLVFTGLILTLV